jgi:hypothetical protein
LTRKEVNTIARAARHDGGVVECYFVSVNDGYQRDIIAIRFATGVLGTFLDDIAGIGLPFMPLRPAEAQQISQEPVWSARTHPGMAFQ